MGDSPDVVGASSRPSRRASNSGQGDTEMNCISSHGIVSTSCGGGDGV